jgi:endonuclease/exonuclease/phosphatase family metal-dependent hydrolase
MHLNVLKALKVVTYNIHKCVGTDRKLDPYRVVAVLRELDADVIALQEADRRFGTRESCIPVAQIESETPWKHVPLGVRATGIGWHGNAILVRKGTSIVEAHALNLPMLEPRGAVQADIAVAGRSVRVIAVHLDLSGLWRRRQVRWLLSHLEQRDAQFPTILLGDFNQWSNRGALSEFAFHHYRILQTPKSFHSSKPVAQLDRIIVSHDIRVEASGVHVSMLSRKASDHLPVWADLAFT